MLFLTLCLTFDMINNKFFSLHICLTESDSPRNSPSCETNCYFIRDPIHLERRTGCFWLPWCRLAIKLICATKRSTESDSSFDWIPLPSHLISWDGKGVGCVKLLESNHPLAPPAMLKKMAHVVVLPNSMRIKWGVVVEFRCVQACK